MSLSLQTRGKKHSHIPNLSNREINWDYIHGKNMEIMLKAPHIMTKAPRMMLEPLRIMANALRIMSIMAKALRIMLEPLRILNSESTTYNARTTAYRQNAVWSLTPAMAFHKRKPNIGKMITWLVCLMPVY
jgi:hypothetical protein